MEIVFNIRFKMKNTANQNLNKISVGCDLCKKKSLRIQRQISKKNLSTLKIEAIKKIVQSIFEERKNV